MQEGPAESDAYDCNVIQTNNVGAGMVICLERGLTWVVPEKGR